MSYDAVAALCAWLQDETGLSTTAIVPQERPDEFITVERTGGQASMGVDEPNLAVQAWSSTYEGAYQLALEVRDLVVWHAVEGMPNVCKAEVGSIYSFPDPDSRQPRYQLDLYLTTRL